LLSRQRNRDFAPIEVLTAAGLRVYYETLLFLSLSLEHSDAGLP
jgi:hypothetical protein